MNWKLTTGLLAALVVIAGQTHAKPNPVAHAVPDYGPQHTEAGVGARQAQRLTTTTTSERRWDSEPPDGLDDGYTKVWIFGRPRHDEDSPKP